MKHLKTYKIFESNISVEGTINDIRDILLNIKDDGNFTSVFTAINGHNYDGEVDEKWFEEHGINIKLHASFGKTIWVFDDDLINSSNIKRLPNAITVSIESEMDSYECNTKLYNSIKENKDDIYRLIDYLGDIGYECYEMSSFGYSNDGGWCRWGEDDTLDKLLAHSEDNGWLGPNDHMYLDLCEYQFRFRKLNDSFI